MLNRPHLPVFINFEQAGNPLITLPDYACSIYSSFNNSASPELLEAMESAQLRTVPFVDKVAAFKALPPTVMKELKSSQRRLLTIIKKEWYVPSDETILNTSVEVLSQEFDGYPAGTVVVTRQTNKATIAFLLPYIRVNLNTGDVLHLEPLPFSNPVAALASPDVSAMPFSAAADSSGMEYAHIALETAATLSFALPQPWGIIGSALLGLINLLLPGSQSNVVKDVMDAIDEYTKQRDMANWLANTKSLMTWCNDQLTVWKDVEPETSLVKDRFLPDLEKELAPGGESLYDNLIKVMEKDYIEKEKDALNVLLVCVSSYLYALRFRLILDAYIASKAHKDDDMETFNEWNNRWRYDYVEFKNKAMGDGGWAPKVMPLINQRIADRLALVKPVVRANTTCRNYDVSWVCHGYAWYDAGIENDQYDNHFVKDTLTDEKSPSPVEHKDQAENDRKAYLTRLAQDLDAQYADAKKTVKAWQDSIYQWNEHLPPGKPQNAPAITDDGWQSDIKEGTPWAKDGQKVRYAVAFYNDSSGAPDRDNPGLISEWTSYKDVPTGKAHPTLSIPVDDLKMATGRRIYRQFDGEKMKLIGLAPGNTTTTYVDKKD